MPFYRSSLFLSAQHFSLKVIGLALGALIKWEKEIHFHSVQIFQKYLIFTYRLSIYQESSGEGRFSCSSFSKALLDLCIFFMGWRCRVSSCNYLNRMSTLFEIVTKKTVMGVWTFLSQSRGWTSCKHVCVCFCLFKVCEWQICYPFSGKAISRTFYYVSSTSFPHVSLIFPHFLLQC